MFHLHYNVGFSFRHLLSTFQHHIGMFRLLFDSIDVCIETQKQRPISWSFTHILTKEYESSESPCVISCKVHTKLRNLDKNDVNSTCIIFLFKWKAMRKNASRVFIDLFKLQRSRFRNLKSIDRWQDEMDVMRETFSFLIKILV